MDRSPLAVIVSVLGVLSFGVVALVSQSGCSASESTPRSSEAEPMPPSAESPSGPFIRVLGTAQDGGFPHAACDGPRCSLARDEPARGRLVASLAVVLPEEDQVYLIDVTPDVREQLDRLRDVRNGPGDRVDRAPVDGVFLTHAHIGHYLGLAFFGFEAIHTSGLPVYGTPRMSDFLSRQGPWDQLVRLGNIELIELAPSQPVSLPGGVTVEALWVPHRDEYTDTVGYLIRGASRTVLYVPDTDPWGAWSTPLEAALEGVDVALLDGSFYSADELPGRKVEEIRHPLMGDTMERLQSLADDGAIEIYFTHLNHSNPVLEADSAERAAIEARGFRILEDLTELPL